jgi:hypothetical protein
MNKLSNDCSPELTYVEIFLINAYYNVLNRINNVQKELAQSTGDVDKTLRCAYELQAINRLQLIKECKDQFWAIASVETLTKIYEFKPFISKYSYADPIIIDQSILPRFTSSWDKIQAKDPKAQLAKKLGATIVV